MPAPAGVLRGTSQGSGQTVASLSSSEQYSGKSSTSNRNAAASLPRVTAASPNSTVHHRAEGAGSGVFASDTTDPLHNPLRAPSQSPNSSGSSMATALISQQQQHASFSSSNAKPLMSMLSSHGGPPVNIPRTPPSAQRPPQSPRNAMPEPPRPAPFACSSDSYHTSCLVPEQAAFAASASVSSVDTARQRAARLTRVLTEALQTVRDTHNDGRQLAYAQERLIMQLYEAAGLDAEPQSNERFRGYHSLQQFTFPPPHMSVLAESSGATEQEREEVRRAVLGAQQANARAATPERLSNEDPDAPPAKFVPPSLPVLTGIKGLVPENRHIIAFADLDSF